MSDCPICLRQFKRLRKIVTLKCKHQYCSNCIKEYATHQAKMFGGQFKCPEPNCRIAFSPLGIISNRLIQLHQKRNNRQSAYPCPWKTCEGTLDKNAKCVECERTACAICLEKPHDGKCSMDITSSISSIYKSKSIKFCPNPKCRTAIAKNGGCMYVVCNKCGTQFHWRTMEISQLSNFDYYQEYLHPGQQDNDTEFDSDSDSDLNYDSDLNDDSHENNYLNHEISVNNKCDECGLDVCIMDNNKCCWCADNREDKSDLTYIENVGLVELNNYWEDYCSGCRAIFEIKTDGNIILD